jgi:hypothetical protein
MEGYWIKGNDITDMTTNSHISDVIYHPEKFGITKEEIENAYKKYGEKLQTEGKAREELIRKVSEKGWIRVRHYTGRKDYWSIQFDVYNKRKKDLANFLHWALYEKKVLHRNSEVILGGYKDGYSKTYVENIAEFFTEEKISPEKIIMKLFEFVNEFTKR